jgi:hypothetical protein
MNMVDTNTELVLQHSSPLITKTTQNLFPSHFSIHIHFAVDAITNYSHQKDPKQQKFEKPGSMCLNELVSFVPRLFLEL